MLVAAGMTIVVSRADTIEFMIDRVLDGNVTRRRSQKGAESEGSHRNK